MNNNAHLSGISYPRLTIPPCTNNDKLVLTNWKHDDRQYSQQVVDHVWIGPMSVLRDKNFIINNNIRVLISLVDPRINNAVNNRIQAITEVPIKSVYIHNESVSSFNGQLQIPSLQKVVDEIELAKASGISSFVFCETGNEKSVAAVAAYLIYSLHFDTTTAVQYVQSRRFSAAPASDSIYYLQTYESMCKANVFSSHSSNSTTKRQLDSDETLTTVSPIESKKRFF